MNYRSAFFTLVLLLFSYALIDNKLQCKTEERGKKKLIKILALQYENYNAQQPKDDITKFKKDFKARFGQSVPAKFTFLLGAEELENESRESNLPRAECIKKIRSSYFLKTFVREEERSWRERHPLKVGCIGLIIGLLIGLSSSK